MKARPRVLVIGGSDPGGRAGVLRDLQVLQTFAVDAACALTAVTAQTDAAVLDVQLMAPAMLKCQVVAAFDSGPVDAVKIGMLGNAGLIEVLVQMMTDCQWPPVVLDPVVQASSGGWLLDPAAHAVLCQQLLPLVTVLTPNVPEAAWLLGEASASEETIRRQQAASLQSLGARNVLLKGGHAEGAVARDLLLTEHKELLLLDAARMQTHMRGTGCMLASAIAAGLACGQDIVTACRVAKAHVHERIRAHALLNRSSLGRDQAI